MVNWVKLHWFRIGLLTMISIIGLSAATYYLVLLPDQVELKRLEEQYWKNNQINAQEAQKKKEYVAKRRGDCYEIYEKERDDFNNVISVDYNEEKDVCVGRYTASKGEWEGIDCKSLLPGDEDIDVALQKEMRGSYRDCISNTFTREF